MLYHQFFTTLIYNTPLGRYFALVLKYFILPLKQTLSNIPQFAKSAEDFYIAYIPTVCSDKENDILKT
jgi:hypothetical protein